MNKLIRNKIPQIIKTERGEVIDTIKMTAKSVEYREALIAKIKEEVDELIVEIRKDTGINNNNREAIREELADVLEVVGTIASDYAITLHQINVKRMQKANIKGSFSDKLFWKSKEKPKKLLGFKLFGRSI